MESFKEAGRDEWAELCLPSSRQVQCNNLRDILFGIIGEDSHIIFLPAFPLLTHAPLLGNEQKIPPDFAAFFLLSTST
jgi:hypothetical protein